MASEITDHDQHASPQLHDDGSGALNVGDANRGTKRPRAAADDDDDDDDKPGRERRKIEIKFITDKSRRHITFSKRKAGIMKKVCCDLRASHCARRMRATTTLRALLTAPGL
jgi:pheromone receptor transcription factor